MSVARVLYLVDSLGLSGKTKAMVDLIAGLDPQRFRASVICLDHEESPLEARLRGLGVDVSEVRCPEGLNLRVVARLAAAPGWRAGPQLRPLVPGQPGRLVCALDRRAQGGVRRAAAA